MVAKTKTREAAAAGLQFWGGMAATLVILVAVAVLFRVDVVKLWPRTAGAYAKVGLSVNPLGLAPENVEAGTGLVNGRAAVVVTGQVRNASRPRPRPASRCASPSWTATASGWSSRWPKTAPGMIAPGRGQAVQRAVHRPAGHGQGRRGRVRLRPDPRPGRTRPRQALDHPADQGQGRAHAAREHPVKQAEPLAEHSPDALPEAAADNNPHHGGKDG